jgi:hypothetical protein
MEKKKLLDVTEQEIKLSFYNYKLLKKEEFTLQGSHIYFVKGCNEVGKSSILQALRAAHEIKDDTPQKVTIGETEGSNEFIIPGPDGKMYNVVYEFTDTTTKFVIFDDEGNKISKITDMRDIFKYNHVDATEFISWSRSAEGRRKQKEYILNLLPSESFLKYKEFEANEELSFNERTKVNNQVNLSKGFVKEYELTKEESEIQKNLDAAKKQLTLRQDEHKKLNESGQIVINLQLEKTTAEKEKERINENITNLNLNLTKTKQFSEQRIKDHQEQIRILEERIKSEEENIKKETELHDAKRTEYLTLLGESNKLIEEVNKKIKTVVDDPDIQKKISELEVIIQRGVNYVDKAKELTLKLEKYNKYNDEYQKVFEKSSSLTEIIEECRKQKELIITEGEFPVDNLLFDKDGYLTINGLRFDEHQTCESDTILLVAQLMCKMNTTPIQILGDASLLDFNKLDRLYDIAEANGKIMFVDEIDRSLDKLVIVGYEKKSKDKKTKETKTSNKALF